MFQFPTFAFLTEWLAFYQPGCPIRKSWDQRLFAPTPSLSQLITSFIASESQGIHRLPLLTFCITDTGSFFIAKIENRVGLIYLQLALFFCYFTFLKLSNTSKIFFYPLRSLSWRITDSNRWPSACKADALASWANPPSFYGSPRQSWTADLYIISVAL